MAATGPLLAQEAPPATPRLSSVTPNPATAGSVVRLEGQDLGSSQTGVILLGDHPLAPELVRSWTDTTVEVRLPAEAGPGRLAVRVGQQTSQTIWLHVLSPDAATRPRPASAEVGTEMAPAAEPSPRVAAAATGTGTPARSASPAPGGLQGFRPDSLVGDSPSEGFRLPLPGSESRRGDDQTGTLFVRVQDPRGRPLYGARIKLDGEVRGRTDSHGRAALDGLGAGDHGITVFLSDYRTAKGEVAIRPGQARDLLVSLSPISPDAGPGSTAPEERRTKLTIRAHPYRSDDQRYSVRRIEVTERGGAGRTWQNTWYRTYDSYVELPCEGAVIGRDYRVTITWYNWRSRHEITSSWEPKVWKEYQQETYYTP